MKHSVKDLYIMPEIIPDLRGDVFRTYKKINCLYCNSHNISGWFVQLSCELMPIYEPGCDNCQIVSICINCAGDKTNAYIISHLKEND